MDPKALDHLKRDPVMAAVIKRVGPIKLEARRLPPFQALTRAIVYQQLSGKAAGTIFERFLRLFPNGRFPTPEAVLKVTPEQLRGAGLSRPKASYVLDLAQKTAERLIPSLRQCDNLSEDELIERLTEVKGVGRWTVEMLLIFNLARPDVLPVHDLGVRKGYKIAYRKRQLPAPEQLSRFGVRWAPYRTTAAWYLWRAAEFLEGDDW
jgi:3-methyladenine DNA glycosylase/8-oxoguanine DNA glycosylase